MSAEYKDVEARVHEQLYNNILMLTHVFPTTKEFESVFKRDMFVKNNKEAFYQVVYYLLNVLDADLTKKTLTLWPPYDIKTENKFRNELLAYINQLRDRYKNVNIPSIMASHLISPGGFMFAKFMLKLSQLVLQEYLQNNLDVDLFHSIKSSKDPAQTNLTIKNVRQLTLSIEAEISSDVEAFEQRLLEYKSRADAVVGTLQKLTRDLQEVTEIFECKKNEFQTTNFDSVLQIIREKIGKFEEELECLEKVTFELKTCHGLINHLLNKKSVLEFDKNDLQKLPQKIEHLMDLENGNLNLQQLFNSLQVLIKEHIEDLPKFQAVYMDQMDDTVTKLLNRYEAIERRINVNKSNLLEIASNYESCQVKCAKLGVEQISGCAALTDESQEVC